MPRPKKKPLIPDVPVNIIDENLMNSAQDEIDLQEFLEQYGGQESTLKVFRIPPNAGQHGSTKARYVERMDPKGLDEDVMRERYGVGTYLLKFFNSQGQYVVSQRVIIDPIKIDEANPAGGDLLRNQKSSQLGPFDMFNFLQQQLLTQQQQNMQLIQTMMSSKNGGESDTGAILQGIGTMVNAMKPATFDPANMMTAMAGFFSNVAKNNNGTDNALDQVQKIMDIVGGVAGGGKDDSLLGVARDLGGKVLDVISHAQRQPAAVQPAPPARVNPPAQLPEALPMEPANFVDVEEQRMIGWIKSQLDYLKKKARKNADVDFWVESTIQNEDEPGNAALVMAMDRGATFENLLEFDAEIRQTPQLQDWFKRFYDGLHIALDPTGPAGDRANLGSDAGSSPAGKPSSDRADDGGSTPGSGSD